MGNCQNDQSQGQPCEVNNNGPVCQLKVTNFIWQSAYQGLFDYQSKKIIQKQFSIKSSSLVQKDKSQIKLIQNEQKQHMNKKAIKRTNFYKILPIYIQVQQYTIQKLIWLIIRTLPDQKYKLSQRDIIKFGKQKVRIKQLVYAGLINNNSAIMDFNHIMVDKEIYDNINDKKNTENNIIPQQNQNNQFKKQLSHNNNLINTQNQIQSIITSSQCTCRICLQPGLKTDPLIAPCKCTGSIRYIHLKCLRMWLGKRLNITKGKHCITLNWVKLDCEMCHQTYRYRIYLQNKKFYTVQIPKPQKPYIVLQVIKRATDKSSGKIYHFVSLSQKNQLSIGRKKDVDVRISDDISVSRHHATLSYDYPNNKFILEDNRSKFGTLVLVKRNIVIKPNMKGVGFQIGTEVYRFDAIRSQTITNPINNQKKQEQLQSDQFINIQQSEDQEIIDQNQNDSESQGKFEQDNQNDNHNNQQIHQELLINDQSPEINHRRQSNPIVNEQ